MRTTVHVVTPTQFRAWIKSQLSASSSSTGKISTVSGTSG